MKKQKRPSAQLSAHSRRLSITVLVAVAIIVVAAISVVSKQLAKSAKQSSAVVAETGKKYVTVKVAGRDVQVDPQTGQIKPMSPEEAQKLADGLKTMLNKSTEGLVQQQRLNGSISMHLKDRFQNVAVARVNADGQLEQSCIDEPEQAARFFGIDPQLLGVDPAKAGANQPATRASRKKVSQ
jgi:hypothetical protein